METLNLLTNDDNQQEFLEFGRNIQFVSSLFHYNAKIILKPFNLTSQQYNVLRILKREDPKGATVNFISNQMLDKNSNGSRIVDKLVAKKLVIKELSHSDKRSVNIKLTEKGREQLQRAEDTLFKIYLERISQMITIDQAQAVNSILNTILKSQ